MNPNTVFSASLVTSLLLLLPLLLRLLMLPSIHKRRNSQLAE